LDVGVAVADRVVDAVVQGDHVGVPGLDALSASLGAGGAVIST
jgi:hypothetical protein